MGAVVNVGARDGFRVSLAVLLALYALLYGGLLLATDFLPYVMDNNETFSSLWHAANLYEFGVSRSWGLADEAFSPHPAAHPYVHTHQGNFPRLFAFLIYVLGARSAEAQIAVTTFTVGVAALVLAYLFFERLATAGFAFTACAVLMTDYVLFAQWQVVTYRVWYAFLLFACLYAVHRAAEDGGARARPALALAFACLFYFELVFAAFVTLFCGLYAIVMARRTPRRIVGVAAAQAAGALAGLGLVVLQAVGYLGWDDFRRDIYLTFLARTDFSSASNLLREAASFYESRQVIFWHNLQEREPFASVLAFVRSLTSYDWRIHTPMLSLPIWILCAGWLAGFLPPRAGAQARSALPRAAGYALLFAGVLLYLLALPAGRSASSVAVAALVALLAAAVARMFSGGPGGWRSPAFAGRTGAFFALAGLLQLLQGTLFDQAYLPLWQELRGRLGAAPALLVAGAVLLAAHLATAGVAGVLGGPRAARLANVLRYLTCGYAAYAIVYLLAPGYIFSGYLARHAPFTVFLTDVIVALGIYVAAAAAAGLVSRQLQAAEAAPASIWQSYAGSTFAALAAGTAAALVIYWAILQSAYVAWLPPTHYAFLKSLAAPPYRGASAVVDNYAAPVAAYTGQWAYFDPRLGQAWLEPGESRIRIAADRRYLWLADRHTNPEYRRPRYFVCMVPQSPATVLARILRERGQGPGTLGCATRPLVRLATPGESRLPGFTLVAMDREGQGRIGFEAWAIVEIDWDRGPRPVVLDWDLGSGPVVEQVRRD